MLTLTAVPAFAEVATNAITVNALTNNGIKSSRHAGAGSILDVIALRLPNGVVIAK